jgi:hypothetical protein
VRGGVAQREKVERGPKNPGFKKTSQPREIPAPFPSASQKESARRQKRSKKSDLAHIKKIMPCSIPERWLRGMFDRHPTPLNFFPFFWHFAHPLSSFVAASAVCRRQSPLFLSLVSTPLHSCHELWHSFSKNQLASLGFMKTYTYVRARAQSRNF